MSIFEGLTGWVARTGKSAFINDTKSDHRFYPGLDKHYNIKTRNLMGIPIFDRFSRVIGVLVFINKKSTLTDEDIDLGESFAKQMSIALENSLLYEDLMETLNLLLRFWLSASTKGTRHHADTAAVLLHFHLQLPKKWTSQKQTEMVSLQHIA
jgi:GAF domain-containing protein